MIKNLHLETGLEPDLLQGKQETSQDGKKTLGVNMYTESCLLDNRIRTSETQGGLKSS
jgi:hypothetical protein